MQVGIDKDFGVALLENPGRNILSRQPLYKVDHRVIGMIAMMLHPSAVERPTIRECYNLLLACSRDVGGQHTGVPSSTAAAGDKFAGLGLPSPAKTGQGFLLKASMNSNPGAFETHMKNQTSLTSPLKHQMFGLMHSPKASANRQKNKDLVLKIQAEKNEEYMDSVSSEISAASGIMSPLLKDTLQDTGGLKSEKLSLINIQKKIPTLKSKLFSERQVSPSPAKLSNTSNSVKNIFHSRKLSLNPSAIDPSKVPDAGARSNSSTPRVCISGREQFKPSNQLRKIVLPLSNISNTPVLSPSQSKKVFTFANALTPQSSPLQPPRRVNQRWQLDNSSYLLSNNNLDQANVGNRFGLRNQHSNKISPRLSLSIHKHKQIPMTNFEVDVKVRVSATNSYLQFPSGSRQEVGTGHKKQRVRSSHLSFGDPEQNYQQYPTAEPARRRPAEATTRILLALTNLQPSQPKRPS